VQIGLPNSQNERWKPSSSAAHGLLPCILLHGTPNGTWRPFAASTDPHFRRYYLQHWGNTTFLLCHQYSPRGTAFPMKAVHTIDIHTYLHPVQISKVIISLHNLQTLGVELKWGWNFKSEWAGACGTHGAEKRCIQSFGGETWGKRTTLNTWG